MKSRGGLSASQYAELLNLIQLAREGGVSGGGIKQLTGDVVAGPGVGIQAATVVKINGSSVPAGPLTTGNVLQAIGAAALGFGPVNLGGGPNFVTGNLPAANQAPQTMGGDVTGTTAASNVVKIQNVPVPVPPGAGTTVLTDTAGVLSFQNAFQASPSFVFRPGGVAAGNVYTTEASLWAAVNAISGKRFIQIDSHLGAATFTAVHNYDGVTLLGEAGDLLTLTATGAIASPTNEWGIAGALAVVSTAAGPAWSPVTAGSFTPTLFMNEFAGLAATTSPFISMAAGQTAAVAMYGGTSLGFAGVAAATVALTASLTISAFDNASIAPNALAGAGAIPIQQAVGSAISYDQPAASNVAMTPMGISVPFGGFPDAIIVQDANITTGLVQLTTTSSGKFTASSVGKLLLIHKAGAAGAPLITTVASFVSINHVTTTAPAVTTVVNGPAAFGTDNGNQLVGILAAIGGTGTTLWVPAGNYIFSKGSVVPSGVKIQGYGATFVAALPQGGFGPITCVLFAEPAQGGTILLTANAKIGDTTIHVASAYGAGSSIVIFDNFRGSSYKILSTSGAGLNLVLDRPLLQNYLFAGAGVGTSLVTPFIPNRIIVEGLTFTGAAQRYIELAICQHCIIRDVTFNDQAGTFTDAASSFDSFGTMNLYDGVTVDGDTRVLVEGNEVTTARRMRLNGRFAEGGVLAPQGAWCNDNVACVWQDCEIGNYSTGMIMATGSADDGNHDVVLDSCVFSGCLIGLDVTASDGLRMSNVTCEGNDNGCHLEAGCKTVHATNCRFINNIGANGIGIQTEASCTFLADTIDLTGNGHFGIKLFGSAIIHGLYSLNGNDQEVVDCDTSAARVVIDGFDITQPSPAFPGFSFFTSGISTTVVTIRNGVVHMTAAGAPTYGINLTGAGVVIIDNVTIDGTGVGAGNAIQVQATTTLRTSGLRETVGITVAGTAFHNRGSVVAAGAGVVNVAWPDLKREDRVTLELATRGGTPGLPPRIVYTPGTGFAIDGVALDTSTYNYVVC